MHTQGLGIHTSMPSYSVCVWVCVCTRVCRMCSVGAPNVLSPGHLFSWCGGTWENCFVVEVSLVSMV